MKANKINLKQEEHISRLVSQASLRMFNKYRAGAKEHGGTLEDMFIGDLLNNAIDEAIDQVIYLLTLKEKMDE